MFTTIALATAIMVGGPAGPGNDADAAWDDVIQYRCGVGQEPMPMPERPSMEYLDEVDRLEEKFIMAFDKVEGGDAEYEAAERSICLEVLSTE